MNLIDLMESNTSKNSKVSPVDSFVFKTISYLRSLANKLENEEVSLLNFKSDTELSEFDDLLSRVVTITYVE